MSNFRIFPLIISLVSFILLTGCNNAANTNTQSTSQPDKPAQPNQSQPSAHTSAHTSEHSGKPKININSAILSELDKLEAKLGIPALSNKIQASRPYSKPEELVTKNVINQQQFDQIKDLVTTEDIALTGEAKDVDYMIKMGLMKGHLLVAKELLDLQKPEQAKPHIGHPVEEIYVDVEEQLKERQVKEFKTTLVNLEDLIKSKPKDTKIAANFQTSMQAVDDAIKAIPETQRQSPEFVLKVINGLLDAANSEYKAAIANGKISAAIEYQDSRGFISYVDTLYQSISEKMSKQYPQTQKAILDSMVKLKTAWPTAIAPTTMVKTPEEVSQLIKKIEQDAQKIIRKS